MKEQSILHISLVWGGGCVFPCWKLICSHVPEDVINNSKFERSTWRKTFMAKSLLSCSSFE